MPSVVYLYSNIKEWGYKGAGVAGSTEAPPILCLRGAANQKKAGFKGG